MNSRINILNELRGISPGLASLPFVHPYQDVPEGYFEGLLDEIQLRIKDEQKSDILDKADKIVPYNVPQGYFKDLPSLIMQRIKAGDQENSDEDIESLSPLLGGLKKKNTFQVPQGYFEDLSGNAIDGAKAIEFVNVELENLSPLMSSLKDKQVFETPAGYFESLPGSMLKIAKEAPPVAKVVSMSTTRKVMRFAVAASVIGIIAVSAWFYSRKTSLPIIPTTATVEGLLQQLSDTELQHFAENENVIIPEPVTATTEIFSDEDVKDLLADIPDEELQKYIDEENGVKNNTAN